MSDPPRVNEPKSLYELNWAHAQDGKLAIDAETGMLIDANPAAEALTGYSRAELIGIHVAMLHPEAERARIGVEDAGGDHDRRGSGGLRGAEAPFPRAAPRQGLP